MPTFESNLPLLKKVGDLIGLLHHEDLRSIAIVLFTIWVIVRNYVNFNAPWGLFDYALWLTSFAFAFYSATIVHNSIHCGLFPREQGWKNQIWQFLLCASYGWPVTTLVPGHNMSHHEFTQTEKDVTFTDQLQYSNNLVNLIMFFPVCSTAIMDQDGKFMEIQRLQGTKLYWQCQKEIVWLVVHQLFVMAFWDLKAWAVAVLLPQLFGKFGIISINYLQHDGCPSPEEDKHNFSRNFVGTTINFFTCNNGYHTAHHNEPMLHWSKLADAHEEKVAPFCHPGINHGNILYYIWTCFFLNQRVSFDNKPYYPKAVPKMQEWVPDRFPDAPRNEDTGKSSCMGMILGHIAKAMGFY